MRRDEAAAPSEGRKTEFRQQVGVKVARRLQALSHPNRSVWRGLGISGIIGWSVAVPAILGAMLGLWLDRRYPGSHSWTLILLMAGLCIGCFQAWNWVVGEEKAMHQEEEIHNG